MSGHGVGGEGEDKRAERAKRALNAMKRATVTLSLKHFILKQRALSLYRTAIRASRGDPLAFFFNAISPPHPQSFPTPRPEKKQSRGSEQNSKGTNTLPTWLV
jgi:hypothetical protein